MNKKNISGFSLVELLVAMLVGLIIMSGIFSLHITTRKTQKINESQMDMVADARFAIDMIVYDLRHSGMWGATNRDGLIECRTTDDICTGSGDEPVAATNACANGWYRNLARPVFATDDADVNPYAATCIDADEQLLAGTDIVEMRYADSNIATLEVGQVYVRSNFFNGKVFVGDTQPVLKSNETSAITQNYALQAFAYYISSFTDTPTDGIPSLRRVALVNGPKIDNQLLISGVVDLQIQFGEDTVIEDLTDENEKVVDVYVNADQVTDWTKVYAAKIWLVMRSDNVQPDVDTTKVFNIAGVNKTFGSTNGFRHFMVSSVVDLKNLKQ